ncbi:MAG: hypothetical protein J6K16_01445 [Alphaproteobacteria bacterium]|nr:hypothetical protein [Alphaproteobacteria bacterium]
MTENKSYAYDLFDRSEVSFAIKCKTYGARQEVATSCSDYYNGTRDVVQLGFCACMGLKL